MQFKFSKQKHTCNIEDITLFFNNLKWYRLTIYKAFYKYLDINE